MASSIASTGSRATGSYAAPTTNASVQNWASQSRELGIENVTYLDQAHSMRPWTSPSPTIFGIDSSLYDQVHCGDGTTDTGDVDTTPLLDAAQGFPSLPPLLRQQLCPVQLTHLSVFRHAVVRTRQMQRDRSEEAQWQEHMQALFKNLLSGNSLSLEVQTTNTPVAETVCAKFNRLTAVKPDILVGLKRSRINFRQGDETIDARIRIETYALARDVLFNLNLLNDNPWFPHLICELKSFQRAPAHVERQMHIGMYYSLNLHLELADRARDADPASYSQRPLDAMLSRVYGLWTIGEQWELWMMCHNESDPNYPILRLDRGSGQDPQDMKHLFSLLDRIASEGESRMQTIGWWLYCLRGSHRDHKRARSRAQEAINPDEEVTPTKRARRGRSTRNRSEPASASASRTAPAAAEHTVSGTVRQDLALSKVADWLSQASWDTDSNSQLSDVSIVLPPNSRVAEEARYRVKSNVRAAQIRDPPHMRDRRQGPADTRAR